MSSTGPVQPHPPAVERSASWNRPRGRSHCSTPGRDLSNPSSPAAPSRSQSLTEEQTISGKNSSLPNTPQKVARRASCEELPSKPEVTGPFWRGSPSPAPPSRSSSFRATSPPTLRPESACSVKSDTSNGERQVNMSPKLSPSLNRFSGTPLQVLPTVPECLSDDSEENPRDILGYSPTVPRLPVAQSPSLLRRRPSVGDVDPLTLSPGSPKIGRRGSTCGPGILEKSAAEARGRIELRHEFEVLAQGGRISVAGRMLGDPGVQDLVQVLGGHASVTDVDVSDNEIGDRGAQSLANLMLSNKKVARIAAAHNKIHHVGAAFFAACLEHNRSLQSLVLDKNYIGPEGTVTLAKGVAGSHLVHLSLCDNHVGDMGAKAVGLALKQASRLEFLSLGGNDLSCDGAMALAVSCAYHPKLKALDLSRNLIGSDGAAALGHLLETNGTLEELNLNDNKLNPPGAMSVIKATGANRKLKILRLAMNNIDDLCLTSSVPSLAKNCTLNFLDLTGNKKITYTGCARVWRDILGSQKHIRVSVDNPNLQTHIDNILRW